MHTLRNSWWIIKSLSALAWLSIKALIFIQWYKDEPFAIDPHIERWAHNTMRMVHATVNIHNPHNTQLSTSTPTIVMTNHCSLFDIPISIMAFPSRLRMLAKKELFKIPIWGWAIKSAGHIAINRSNPREAAQGLEQAKQSLKKGVVIWLAPEGTRSPDGKLQAFKSGGFRLALAANATIIPITICGSHHIAAKQSTTIHGNQIIDVIIGKPIDTKAYDKQSIGQLKEQVRQQMADALAKYTSS